MPLGDGPARCCPGLWLCGWFLSRGLPGGLPRPRHALPTRALLLGTLLKAAPPATPRACLLCFWAQTSLARDQASLRPWSGPQHPPPRAGTPGLLCHPATAARSQPEPALAATCLANAGLMETDSPWTQPAALPNHWPPAKSQLSGGGGQHQLDKVGGNPPTHTASDSAPGVQGDQPLCARRADKKGHLLRVPSWHNPHCAEC